MNNSNNNNVAEEEVEAGGENWKRMDLVDKRTKTWEIRCK